MADIDDRRAESKMVFGLLDRDRSGYIDSRELAAGLRGMGSNPTDDEIEQIMCAGDINTEDGKLNCDEFCNLMERYVKPASHEEEALIDAFRCFDKNGDGKINRTELREALTTMGTSKMTKEEVDDLFDRADTDHNGYIDFRELVKIMMKY